ncbi:MAG: hypothetical protein AAGB22_09515, partial [Bacteroidota bacterium]
MTTLTAPAATASGISAADVNAIHDQLREQYKHVAPADMGTDAQTEALMAYNGYYAIDGGNGDFFTIDTNMVVNGDAVAHHITLILFLKSHHTPIIFPFTGSGATFENNVLKLISAQTNQTIPNLNLTFARGANGVSGPAAGFHGTIQLQQQPGDPKPPQPLDVKGITYNNPIPMEMYSGTYYDNKGAVGATAIMKIDGNSLFYNYADQLSGPGEMVPVTNFIYNQNMYFFSFSKTYPIAGKSCEFNYRC